MKVIYEPKGRAKEYADLACNSYTGCPHACVYCFAPNVMRSIREKYHAEAKPRIESIKKWFEHDCILMEESHDTRRVHMNFISDPYPEIEKELHLTRFCIETAMKHGVKMNVLTKGRYDVVRPDFGLFKEADVHFGVTCCWYEDRFRKEWEPNASSVQDRVRLLAEAHGMGIYTWVSMEPVVYPQQAMEFYRANRGNVDLWKVGKLNYHEHAKTVDWVQFRLTFTAEADKFGSNYIIKKDLLEA